MQYNREAGKSFGASRIGPKGKKGGRNISQTVQGDAPGAESAGRKSERDKMRVGKRLASVSGSGGVGTAGLAEGPQRPALWMPAGAYLRPERLCGIAAAASREPDRGGGLRRVHPGDNGAEPDSDADRL